MQLTSPFGFEEMRIVDISVDSAYSSHWQRQNLQQDQTESWDREGAVSCNMSAGTS